MKPIKGEGGGGERDETGPVPMGVRGYISRVGGGHPLRGGGVPINEREIY